MTRTLGRSFSAAVLGALAGAAWLALFYGFAPVLRIDFDVTPPALVSGVYPAERDDASGLTFAWTAGEMDVHLPGLDRHVDWIVTARLRGARPSDNPAVEIFADGLRLAERPTAPDFEVLELRVPARPERNGLALRMRVSQTMVPGPHDPRQLGVMLDWVMLAPDGVVLAPRRAFAGAVLTSAAMGAALALLGMTAGSAVGSVVLLSAAVAATIARGFGPYTDFPDTAVRLAVWIGLLMAGGTVVLETSRRQPLRNTAKFAVAFSGGALLLKLLILLHPGMPIGDAMFHAHRFRDVVAGNLHFTSIAPGGYRFPYAPGLYVVAWPFAGIVQPRFGDMMLLRIITAAADTFAGLLLYLAIVRSGRDRLAAAFAIGLHHMMPLGFRILTVGNLTNAFAQSLAVAALVLLATGALRARPRGSIILLTLVLSGAFLSHTSTFAILVMAALVIALLFLVRGEAAARASAAPVALALVLATVVSVVLYYAHFLDTYRAEFARISAETVQVQPDAGGRGVIQRFSSVPRYLYLYAGVPALVLGIWGATVLWRQGSRDALGLSITGWLLTCGVFLAIGIVTPLDLRYYLAALPAIALAGGLGANDGWRRGGWIRGVAAALLVWTASIGVTTWWRTF